LDDANQPEPDQRAGNDGITPAEFAAQPVTPSEVTKSTPLLNPEPIETIDMAAGDNTSNTLKPPEVMSNEQPANQPQTPKRRRAGPEKFLFPRALRNKLGKAARPLSILILLIIVGGMSYGGYYYHNRYMTVATVHPIIRFQAKIVGFKIISTTPSNNQQNVNPATPITLTFNQPVSPQKLSSAFFVSPTISGKYSQGNNKDQVIFTPGAAFAQGTKVQIMINGTFQSQEGSKLGADCFYGFTTSIPDSGVLFQDQNGLIDTLSTAASGQKLNYTLLVGSKVAASANSKITLYHGNLNLLLNSLVYKNTTAYGVTSQDFVNQYVDTTGLNAISTANGIANNQSYSVNQGDGIYLAVATGSTGKQLGYVWIVISNFGVLMRQDDQKIVYDVQNFSGGAVDVPANVGFYNLNDSVNLLASQTANGLTTETLPLMPSVDVMVASFNGEYSIVPVSVFESQGDIRADRNLSVAQDIFGLTNKPTYQVGNTIHIAGFVRQDNDAQYSVPSGGTLQMYIANPTTGGHLLDFNATIGTNGMFSANIPTSAAWLSSGTTLNKFQIFADALGSTPTAFIADTSVASFSLTNQPPSLTNISVQFSRSSYLPTDTISAQITADNTATGQPLANASINVHIFSKDYYENDPSDNFLSFGSTGSEIKNSPQTVQLNGSGQAIVNIPVSELPSDGYSQQVTLQANVAGSPQGAGAAGGASTIVHQGNGILVFGMGRTIIAPGGVLIGRVYAEQLNGSPLPNATIHYTLTDNASSPNGNAVIASGTTSADSKGYAQIDINLPANVKQGDSLTLKAITSDSMNNQIEAQNYYYVQDPSGAEDYSGAQLGELDVSGSSGNVQVGQTLNLTINAPRAMRVMVTMDRGRIYNPRMLNLNAGNNSFSINVTKQLAPSFTLTFAYFQNGNYHSEGTSFNVSEPQQKASLTLSGANQTAVANQPLSLKVNVRDAAGNPLQTGLIVSVVSATAYDLYNQVVPSMYASLYSSRPLMTSSSSSLTNIGSGGGKCGGGGFGAPSFANAVGTTLLWQPDLTTDANGNATINFTPPKGSWQVNIYSMDANSVVGSTSAIVNAN
jgi:hypothetical protein